MAGFRNSILAGLTLIREAIQSQNYQAGSQGWKISADGDAEFNDVVVRGTLESSNYVPGVSGWHLDDDGSAEFYEVLIRGDTTGDVIVVGPAGLPQVSVGSLPTTGYVRWTSNRPLESRPSEIVGGFANAGLADEFSAMAIAGPAMAGADDHVRIHLRSQPNDGSDPAMVQVYNYDGVSLEEIFQLNREYLFLIGPRTILQPGVLTDTGLFINLLAGHTGRAIRVQLNAVDVFEVHSNGDTEIAGDLDVGGELSAANIQSGTVVVTPTVANEWTANVAVVFPVPFATAPALSLTCTAGAPGSATTTELEIAAASVTTTGFNCRIRRGNLTATTLTWLAISTP